MSDHKDMTHRHLRHKLQSLARRLDELEEATNKLQKSEDELLDLQDKIIQAEGSNSSLLGDIEALRKRLLKIQGKDEEVRKAEDLCRTVREKLEEEENLTKELKAEIEHLQRRMAELEKLEEAFGKSKSDCSQLCLSLNEEKNLTKKLSSELDTLKGRLKEVEGAETKLDRAEQALNAELEKLKGFSQTFVSERKRLLEKQREDEKRIIKLNENLEHQKNRLGMSQISLVNKSENEKNTGLEGSHEEDNKVKELTQEIERLKNRLKQLEIVEVDLKNSESKNGELHEKFQAERNRVRQLSEQVEQLRTQLCGKGGGNGTSYVDKHGNGSGSICPNNSNVVENGKAENEEIIVKGGFRQEKPKYRSAATVSEPSSPKHRNRELSPQHKRETKLRSKELSNSEESSPKSARRALSPSQRSRRTPKTPTTAISTDNGIRDTRRGTEEKTKGATDSSMNTSASDSKKVSVLSRYPPAANDQKTLKTTHKQADGETKKIRVEKFSKLYVGSDSESNNSDVVLESSSNINSISALEKDTASVSDQESIDHVEETVCGSATSTLTKANGSYTAYRSHVTPLLPNDQGSEGHSSASETESTSSRPSELEPATETSVTNVSSRTTTSRYPRYSRVHDSYSEGSSSRSSFDEELHSRTQSTEGSHQGSVQTPSGIEIQRVCSPREALRSKAVIKPAIVEIDRKEVMISESLSTNGKPKISTKPIVTTTSKMTSSITIYPSDPSSSRTSSRSSSVSSEPTPIKERHTSTSNILIGPSIEHHGSISIPYEISIPKSEITLRSCQDQDCGADDPSDLSSRSKLYNASRVETTTSHLHCQRSNFSLQSQDASAADLNDTESGFESSSSTATVASWRRQRQSQYSQEDSLPDLKNVTVRSTWKNRGTASVDETGRGRGVTRTMLDGGSEDEAEAATTWRAYRATTFDTEETNSNTAAGGNPGAQKGVKPSPAEVYMRRINSVAASTKEAEELLLRRGKHSPSPTMETGGLGRTIPHTPVTSQSWGRSYTQQPPASDNIDTTPKPSNSPAAWRRQIPSSDSHHLGSCYDRASKTAGTSSRGGELWSGRGQGSGARAEGRSSAASRPWNHRQSEHH